MKWIRPLERFAVVFGLALFTLLLVTGCQTTDSNTFDGDKLHALLQKQTGGRDTSNDFRIREGDVLSVKFPGAGNLNTKQTVRRDGKIELPLLGELQAAGLTPLELERDILKSYGSQLLSKEVTVTVESATYDVFVTGAVVKPGKVSTARPITALEAIMQAGGPDYTKANLKQVKVIRQENGHSKNYQINLRDVMDGKSTESFYLKPSDIIYVREKFNWF